MEKKVNQDDIINNQDLFKHKNNDYEKGKKIISDYINKNIHKLSETSLSNKIVSLIISILLFISFFLQLKDSSSFPEKISNLDIFYLVFTPLIFCLIIYRIFSVFHKIEYKHFIKNIKKELESNNIDSLFHEELINSKDQKDIDKNKRFLKQYLNK